MKMFSKIMAVALTAIMTACLTSCEDESVPAYGTGIGSETESSVRYNLSPTAPVETEPAAPVEAYIYNAMIGYSDEIGDYVAVTIMVTNNTGEDQNAGSLVGIDIRDNSGVQVPPCTSNPAFMNDEGRRKKIDNDEQIFVVYTCAFVSQDIGDVDYIDITLRSKYVDDILDSQRFYLTEE